MPKDKYSAVWLSHSSIGDFLKCPRSYYLKNVYKNPKTRHKIQLMSPALALGQAVHKVIESLSNLSTKDRFKTPLIKKFEKEWKKVSGINGGFTSPDQEEKFKKRGEAMLRKVVKNPGPVANLAVKIQKDLPYFWVSEEDNLILCGKIDWLEYLPDTDSVHIIDFKTSKNEEDPNSLQLPIYHLLVHNCQKREVSKASYWYLEFSDELEEQELPDLTLAREKIIEIGKKIKLARSLELYKCPQGEGACYACRDLEKIVQGKAKFVGTGEYKRDIYVVERESEEDKKESVIL